MGYSEALKELLRPLGIYDLSDGTINVGELEAIGAELDRLELALDRVQKEMLLTTAEEEGLALIEELLVHCPQPLDLAHRRAALAALLRIGGDSYTLEAINDNLAGCGLNAKVSETDELGVVEVRFPEVPGIPDGFAEMSQIIEDIIPCHLLIRYVYWYITWEMVGEKFRTWGALEQAGLTWEALEKLVL
jgi:hypothetical protein